MRITNELENVVVLLASGGSRSLRSIAVEVGLNRATVRRVVALHCGVRSTPRGGTDALAPRGTP